jgi:hypothetical protein
MRKISLDSIKPNLQHRRSLIEKILTLKGWDIESNNVIIPETEEYVDDMNAFNWNMRYFKEVYQSEN